MINKIYIESDIRNSDRIIYHKFIIKTFKKCKVNNHLTFKLKIDLPDLSGVVKKQFVMVKIVEKINTGKRLYKGVIE